MGPESVHGVESDAEDLRLVVHSYLFIVYLHFRNGFVLGCLWCHQCDKTLVNGDLEVSLFEEVH